MSPARVLRRSGLRVQDASKVVKRRLFLGADLLAADAHEASHLVGLRGSLSDRDHEALVLLDIRCGPLLADEAKRLSQSLGAEGREVPATLRRSASCTELTDLGSAALGGQAGGHAFTGAPTVGSSQSLGPGGR